MLEGSNIRTTQELGKLTVEIRTLEQTILRKNDPSDLGMPIGEN